MQFFKGKEDMGVEASLKLLDLQPDATIDDANQAYTDLHRMIDRFHQDNIGGKRGSRQEDMDLLTCAYEKAIAYISDRNPHGASIAGNSQSADVSANPVSKDLHFTINFPSNGMGYGDHSSKTGSPIPEPDQRTVAEAMSITARRLEEAEAALPDAQQAVESALAVVAESDRRHEQARQARLNALVTAKSAKSRALLMEVEAKRAMQEAISVAEKARERAAAARRAADEARVEAEGARQRADRMAKSKETAAAEVICAEDRLDKEKSRLKALTHILVTERDRMNLFRNAQVEAPMHSEPSQASSAGCTGFRETDSAASERQRILDDLLAIESSLNSRRLSSRRTAATDTDRRETSASLHERREQPRLSYPPDQRPLFCIGGRQIPVVDVSTNGLGLESDNAMDGLRIVRGDICLDGRRPVKITGRVVRRDENGLGMKLVTRIGDRILDEERLRLSA